MLPNVFKTSKSIDFDKLMKNYIVKNYDINSYTQEVQSFISQYQQTRNVIILLNDKDKTYDSLRNTKDVLVQYLTTMNVIKSKMNFGKDEFSIKVEFGWRDNIKNDMWYSYNINHEHYTNLFNLATIYYCMGSAISISDDDVKLKEAIKHLQYSAWLFDNIKNELPSLIPAKETPPDMTQNYLTYCSYICLATAQTYLLVVAERKKSSYELQGQLAKGIFDLYTSALGLANDSLKKTLNDETRIYLNNRRFYYVALSMVKMKESILEEFNKTGEGYGKAIAYLGLACDSLNNGYKDIKKIKNYIDIQAYEDFKSGLEQLGSDMLDKNTRIYFQLVPELATLTKLDKKIMVNPQQIPDNLNSGLDGGNHVLDSLVPREVKGMIEGYKRQMMEYISENLNKYQNESEIMAFLTELNLPYSLETVLSQNEISESLWKKISEVQQKGGSMFLTNNITNLEKKGEEVVRRIADMLQIINNEEEEDKKYRTQYGERWSRTASNTLNFQYINVLQEYAKKLDIAKNCDGQIKVGVMDVMKNFELLGMSKTALGNKIPVKTDINAIKNCEEAAALRKDLDTMDGLKEKCMEWVNKIFQTLNEDNTIPQFIKVLQKKTTEKSILADNKPKYEAMFKELETISEEIKILKISIVARNEVFLRAKQTNFKTSDENEKFFRELEDYCKIYNQKLINLQQGMNFYTEFNRRLNDINGHITDFLVSRDIEKNDIIKLITGGSGNGVKNNTGGGNVNRGQDNVNNNNMFYGNKNNNYWDFTNTPSNQNPNKNLITNLGTGSNKQYGASNNNNMININPNSNLNPNINNTNNLNNDFNNMNFNNYNNNSNSNANINKFTNPNQNPNNGFR